MIAFNQIRRAERPKWSRARAHGVQLIPACLYGFSPPRGRSGIVVNPGAQRVLEWWPHSRQQALYAVIAANRLSFEPKANGCELAELSERFQHHCMVVRRTPELVTIMALYNELPTWGAN